QGSEERERPMALVVMSAALSLAGAHRQQRLGPIKRLDLRLLVDAQHDRALRWIEIKTDDIAHLFHKQRVRRELGGLAAMWLQAKRLPDAVDRRRRVTDRLG